jgi:hypothetical protein
MSIPRAIGYIGIALLALIAALGLVIAFSNRDWHGVLVMLGFVAILLFLTHGLRSAAKRESNPALKAASDLGWAGEPLSALFRGPILHTPEGLIMLFGSMASIVFALLSFFLPSLVGLATSRSAINATTFGMWPVLLFVAYVRLCAPHFQPSIFSSLIVLVMAGSPFYLAYK